MADISRIVKIGDSLNLPKPSLVRLTGPIYQEEITLPNIDARFVIEIFYIKFVNSYGWQVKRIYGEQDISIAENTNVRNLEDAKIESRNFIKDWLKVYDQPNKEPPP